MIPRDFLTTVPPGAEAVAYGAAIHRYVPHADWPEALARVPADKRAGAEEYLRGIAQRMRAKRDSTRAQA